MSHANELVRADVERPGRRSEEVRQTFDGDAFVDLVGGAVAALV